MNIRVFHKTDYRSALSILQSGFDLNKFGHATKKSGQDFSSHPAGVYFSIDDNQDPRYLLDHPWDHRDRGVLVFATVLLNNPLLVNIRMDGKFYQNYLSEKYGSKGLALTRALQKDGYDGIYCEESGEVVVFDLAKIEINNEKTNQSIETYKKNIGFKEWFIFDF